MKMLQRYDLKEQKLYLVLAKYDIEFKLNQFAILLPTKNQYGEISKEKFDDAVLECQKKLRSLAGGTTESKLFGTYVMSNNEVASENIIEITAFFYEITPEILEELLEFCIWVKEYLEQEKIGALLNQHFFMI